MSDPTDSLATALTTRLLQGFAAVGALEVGAAYVRAKLREIDDVRTAVQAELAQVEGAAEILYRLATG